MLHVIFIITQVVAHLIGHEGKGSVRSLLVEKGWGNSVQAAVTNDITDMQMVSYVFCMHINTFFNFFFFPITILQAIKW